MRMWPTNRFVPGDCKRECPRCGFDLLESELVYEPRTKSYVCQECYDPYGSDDLPRQVITERPFNPKGSGEISS